MPTYRLPLLADVVLPPTVDAMRERLGGRVGAPRFAECGTPVVCPGPAGPREGVVLTSDESGAYVWFSASEVRRVARAEISTPESISAATEALVSDARAFGELAEGQVVVCTARDGAAFFARIVEKCRFGALVVREDAVIVGVGLQALRAVLEQ
jgi:hypothetical protein